jgi:hypothetical protein
VLAVLEDYANDLAPAFVLGSLHFFAKVVQPQLKHGYRRRRVIGGGTNDFASLVLLEKRHESLKQGFTDRGGPEETKLLRTWKNTSMTLFLLSLSLPVLP